MIVTATRLQAETGTGTRREIEAEADGPGVKAGRETGIGIGRGTEKETGTAGPEGRLQLFPSTGTGCTVTLHEQKYCIVVFVRFFSFIFF